MAQLCALSSTVLKTVPAVPVQPCSQTQTLSGATCSSSDNAAGSSLLRSHRGDQGSCFCVPNSFNTTEDKAFELMISCECVLRGCKVIVSIVENRRPLQGLICFSHAVRSGIWHFTHTLRHTILATVSAMTLYTTCPWRTEDFYRSVSLLESTVVSEWLI